MRRKKSLWTGLSVMALVGSTALGLPSASAASTAASADKVEYSAGLIHALQHDLGLTERQARVRLKREKAAAELAPKAEKAAGGAFGGSWFDPGTGRLVVGVTSAARAAKVRDAGAGAVIVAHSAKELAATQAVLDARARAHKAPAGVAGWHVDPRSSTVVVDVVKGEERTAPVREFIAAADKAGPVTVESKATAAPRTFAAGTVGGDPYYTGNVRCSIGFSVYGGFVTAGHCGSPWQAVYGWDRSYMGNFQGSSFPGNDYAWVNVGSGWWTVPVVLGWGTVPDALVRGSWEAPIGSSICRSGSTSHWHCGQVQSKNDTVNYAQGAVYEMTGTSVCAEGGDSGGSFITGDQAQGVTSGGYGNCSSGGRTWFQPINEILRVYGLRLHTA
ncbi:alpha-lytic protease prodomain-containing protein [Wenjunlia tyrosinilytica]|jgi:hypothetical protein|uniref:Serine protease n=1 Tax=Wenjunlia tyrosinilytica TaxID=1544741 RepID=A0A918E121_9ACTN|nr:alpha-lytic protease prodomain-containing protein [Wenjunlia tyrosinilytica]GGO96365.1 serine protease [Wenjunlia tyrosinilytica]